MRPHIIDALGLPRKLSTYATLRHYTNEEMNEWLKNNVTFEQMVNLLSLYILEDLNEADVDKVSITEEQLEEILEHFRVIKHHRNPRASKKNG